MRDRRERRTTAARKPRPPTSLFDARLLAHVRSWVGVAVPLRLAVDDLVAGRIRPVAVGGVRDVVPAVRLAGFAPVPDVDEYFSDDDPVGDWWSDGTGAFCARAAVTCVAGPDPQPAMLDVAGGGFALARAQPGLSSSHVIEATGTLHLDPRFDQDGVLAATGEWCREPMRLTALRRYVLDEGGENEPGDPTTLDRIPDPWDVQEASLYVADFAATARAR